MKKLLLLVSAGLFMVGCSDAPTAPAAPKKAPSIQPSFDLVCRSGYVVAYDENGNPYCAPVQIDQTHQSGTTLARPQSKP